MRSQLPTTWYQKKQVFRGRRGGFYTCEPKKRYWSHRRLEFIIKRRPIQQNILPDDVFAIIWEYKESIDIYRALNVTFTWRMPYADHECLKACAHEEEHPIDTAIRVYPRGSQIRKQAKRLLANF